MAHYKEVCDKWTLSDLWDAHDIIDQQQRAQERIMAKARSARGG
jgi:hypothetical protein